MTVPTRIVLIVAMVASVAACARPDRDLERKIALEFHKGPGTVIRLASLTSFQWDIVHVFPPYSSKEIIDKQLGISWPEASRTGIFDSDAISLLVFMRNGSVVRYARPLRSDGDFADIDNPHGLEPAKAVFVVGPGRVFRLS